MRRILWTVGAMVVTAALIAPFLPLPFLRPTIEQALANRLGRKVAIEEVSVSLLAGPGFALSGVSVGEDPRAGIEPFIYAPTADARVDLLGLIRGRRGFSSLRLANATLNLVKTDAGPWNFQHLLEKRMTDAPALHLRGTRVNLKVGQTKAFLYFDDADVDISAGGQGSLDVNFAGVPGRTDRAAQNSGRVFVRGSWAPAAEKPLNMRVEMEPSALDGIANLLGRTWFSLQGQVALNAQLAGSPAGLAIAGEIQLDEGRRSDFLPNHDAVWKLRYRGTLDLHAGNLSLENLRDAKGGETLAVRLEATNVLTSPEWSASAALSDSPLGPVVEAAMQIGAPMPEHFTAQGTLSGALNYGNDAGFAANLEAHDAELTFPNSPKMKATIPIKISAQTVTFGPATVAVGETQSAQIEARYLFDGSAAADVRTSTKEIDIGALRSLIRAPLLEPDIPVTAPRGEVRGSRSGGAEAGAADANDDFKSVWRGNIRYQRVNRDEEWTGDYSVENARLTLDGIAEPIHVRFANVNAAAGRWNVTKMKGTVGDVAFAGEYHFDPKARDAKGTDAKTDDATRKRPHKFTFQVDQASAVELARLVRPSTGRGAANGQRSRDTIDWLGPLAAEGTISIDRFDAGDRRYAVNTARILWDGPSLQISSIVLHPLNSAASESGAALAGKIIIDLAAQDGRVSLDLADHGKPVQFAGTVASLAAPPPEH